MVEKHIIKNRTADRRRKRIIIMTSINFERISFFLEQLREYIAFQWVETLNLNEIHRLNDLSYDCIFCFSTRIFNILNSRELPVIRVNFFLENKDIDRLLKLDFLPRHIVLTPILSLLIWPEKQRRKWYPI